MTKALRLPADCIILDLEDSVVTDRKAMARLELKSFLNGEGRIKPIFVRINPLASGLAQADLSALI